MRWSHSAGIKLAIRAGYQTLGMGGARGGLELPPGHSPDLEERFLKYLVLVWELWLIVSGRWVPQGIGFDRREVASKHSAKLRAMPRRTWMNRDSRKLARWAERCSGTRRTASREEQLDADSAGALQTRRRSRARYRCATPPM